MGWLLAVRTSTTKTQNMAKFSTFIIFVCWFWEDFNVYSLTQNATQILWNNPLFEWEIALLGVFRDRSLQNCLLSFEDNIKVKHCFPFEETGSFRCSFGGWKSSSFSFPLSESVQSHIPSLNCSGTFLVALLLSILVISEGEITQHLLLFAICWLEPGQ